MSDKMKQTYRAGLSSAPHIRILLTLIVVVLLLVGGGAATLMLTRLDVPTKLGAVADLLAAGAFVLALVAAFVATLAYGVAILKPDLRAEVRFGHGGGGATLPVYPPEGPMRSRNVYSSMQSTVFVHLHNYGPVSARNPALQIKLIGMMFGGQDQPGWSYGGHFHGLGGYEWAQWDGGADYSIHPNWGRDLPMLQLHGLIVFAEPEPAMQLEVVADGFSAVQKVEIILKEAANAT